MILRNVPCRYFYTFHIDLKKVEYRLFILRSTLCHVGRIFTHVDRLYVVFDFMKRLCHPDIFNPLGVNNALMHYDWSVLNTFNKSLLEEISYKWDNVLLFVLAIMSISGHFSVMIASHSLILKRPLDLY